MQYSPEKQSNGMAIASLICGITGFCLLIPSIVAVILGIFGMRKPKLKSLAVVGLTLGVVGLLWWAFILINGGAEAFMEGFNEGYQGAMR